MSSRAMILGQIRSGLNAAGAPDRQDASALEARIAKKGRGIIPDRVNLDQEGLIDLFTRQAQKVNATVARVADDTAVPQAISDYLASENLPAAFKMAPHPELQSISWEHTPSVTVTEGISDESDVVGLSRGVCGVAETGTLFMGSGAESPITLNFLPETHIVLIRSSEVKGAYEDGWDMVRKRGMMPRAVNLITGPSRTGDIEQTIYLGAHGPRRLHIIMVDDS